MRWTVLSLVSTFLLSNAFAKEYFYTRSERDSSDSLRNELNAAYIDGTVEPAALASAVDDAPSEYIDIGFSFPFSGSSYSKMGVDSNGFINFQSFSPCNEKYCLQDSKNSISPFSVDLFPGLVYDLLNSDAILEDAYYGLQPEAFNIFVFKKPNQTTVMWEKREVFRTSGNRAAILLSFAATVFKDGRIQFEYDNDFINSVASWDSIRQNMPYAGVRPLAHSDSINISVAELTLQHMWNPKQIAGFYAFTVNSSHILPNAKLDWCKVPDTLEIDSITETESDLEVEGSETFFACAQNGVSMFCRFTNITGVSVDTNVTVNGTTARCKLPVFKYDSWDLYYQNDLDVYLITNITRNNTVACADSVDQQGSCCKQEDISCDGLCNGSSVIAYKPFSKGALKIRSSYLKCCDLSNTFVDCFGTCGGYCDTCKGRYDEREYVCPLIFSNSPTASPTTIRRAEYQFPYFFLVFLVGMVIVRVAQYHREQRLTHMLHGQLVPRPPKQEGLTKAEIEIHTKTLAFSPETEIASGDSMCAICICEFEDEETLRELRCGHIFHTECVDEWFERASTCPLCKQEAANEPNFENEQPVHVEV